MLGFRANLLKSIADVENYLLTEFNFLRQVNNITVSLTDIANLQICRKFFGANGPPDPLRFVGSFRISSDRCDFDLAGVHTTTTDARGVTVFQHQLVAVDDLTIRKTPTGNHFIKVTDVERKMYDQLRIDTVTDRTFTTYNDVRALFNGQCENIKMQSQQ